MIELDRRAFVTGLAAIAVAGTAPVKLASAGTTASNIHRLFLHDEDKATRWQFLQVVSDPFGRYSVEQLMPSSLWEFDAHLNFKRDDRLFSLRHVASGLTFRQVRAGTAAFRFDYWDMSADERPTWVDTTDITILGDAGVCALAGILCRPTRTVKSPFRVRFSPARYSCLKTPAVVEVKAAAPLDHYAHVDD